MNLQICPHKLGTCHECADKFALENKIESLKAITELAVHELKLQLEASIVWGMDGTAKRIRTTLSEIERLLHEQT